MNLNDLERTFAVVEDAITMLWNVSILLVLLRVVSRNDALLQQVKVPECVDLVKTFSLLFPGLLWYIFSLPLYALQINSYNCGTGMSLKVEWKAADAL